MSIPILLLSLCSVALTPLVFASFRNRTLLYPGKLYALLFAAHISIPALLVGLGMAPRFVNLANEAYLV